MYEYKPSNSLQDASGSSLAGSTNYLNYGAARCSSAAQFFIADNLFARRDLQSTLSKYVDISFHPEDMKTHTHSGRAHPTSKHQLRQEMSPTLRPSIAKEHACIPGRSSIVAGRIDTMPCENRCQARFQRTLLRLAAFQMSSRSITSDDGFKTCRFWQSSLVFEYSIIHNLIYGVYT